MIFLFIVTMTTRVPVVAVEALYLDIPLVMLAAEDGTLILMLTIVRLRSLIMFIGIFRYRIECRVEVLRHQVIGVVAIVRRVHRVRSGNVHLRERRARSEWPFMRKDA